MAAWCRAVERINGYQVTVFTDPALPRAGPVDVSVLVQDSRGQPRPDLGVDVWAWPAASPQQKIGGPATNQAATNKLLRALALPLSQPGTWHIEVTAAIPEGPAVVAAAVEVGEPLPSWLDLAGWIGWPVLPILLFLIWVLRQRNGAARP